MLLDSSYPLPLRAAALLSVVTLARRGQASPASFLPLELRLGSIQEVVKGFLRLLAQCLSSVLTEPLEVAEEKHHAPIPVLHLTPRCIIDLNKAEAGKQYSFSSRHIAAIIKTTFPRLPCS
jgi:hypothetical protein